MKKYFCFLSILFLVFSCTTTEPEPPKSSEKQISNIALSGISGATSNYDAATNTHTVNVPAGTDVKAIPLNFTVPAGATASPAPGSVQDLSKPLTVTITAADGSKQTITIVVVVPGVPKSAEKQILEFSFKAFNPLVKAIIDQKTFKITAEVPQTADLSKLVPSIVVSPKATVNPATEVAQNFANAVIYEVIAERRHQTAIRSINKKRSGVYW